MCETPVAELGHLLTGHYRERRGYRAWRTNGTLDWLIIYTVSGRGRFGYAGGDLLTEAGDLVFLAPRTLHDYGVAPGSETWELIWAHVYPRPHWEAFLRFPQRAPGLLHLQVAPAQRPKIEARLRDVHALATGGLAQREAFAMNALEHTLLLLDALNPAGSHPLDPRVVSATAYLRRHLDRTVRLQQVAEACHLSVSRLSHLFREQVGMTPLAYLEMERLERAKRLLLLTGLPVQSVAAEVGFENPFYFTRRFKKATGHSPRDFRRTARA